MINGKIVINDGEFTGTLSGKALRREDDVKQILCVWQVMVKIFIVDY